MLLTSITLTRSSLMDPRGIVESRALLCQPLWSDGRLWERRYCLTPPQRMPSCLDSSPPGAASGSHSARTNSGRGHGKRGDGSTESCCHWRSDLPACVRAYTRVCARQPSSVDAQTDCQSLGCMHDLSLSFLCKQQCSGVGAE